MKFFLWDTFFVGYLLSVWSRPEGNEALGHLLFLVEVGTASVWQQILFILPVEGGRRGCLLVPSNWMLRKADICVRSVETTLDLVISLSQVHFVVKDGSQLNLFSFTHSSRTNAPKIKTNETNRWGDCAVLVGEDLPSSLFFADEEGGFHSSHCRMQQTSSVDTHKVVTFLWKRTWFWILFPWWKFSRQEDFLNCHIFQVGVQQIKVPEVSSVTLVIVWEWQWDTLCEGNGS